MKAIQHLYLPVLLVAGLVVLSVACQSDKAKSTSAGGGEAVQMTLFDKGLPEIKQQIDGRWELRSGKNAREEGEFENTFIEFRGDQYAWIEDGQSEAGELNWRKAPTGAGYDSWLMDVFYAERPAYPIAISGDTLYIQDISDTGYKYTLVRKAK